MFLNTVSWPNIFEGGTKLIWKSTSKLFPKETFKRLQIFVCQKVIKKRLGHDFLSF